MVQMIEDPLTAAQRIRLESVAQANARLGEDINGIPHRAITELLQEARRIEAYILGGKIDE